MGERVFEAQLYCPVDKDATDMKQPLGPCFDKLDRKLFLRNPRERALRGDDSVWSDHAHKPLTALLRTCNIIGGGFGLTPTSRVPAFIHGYAERHVRAEYESVASSASAGLAALESIGV